MKYLRSFNENINSSEIDAICEKYNIQNYTINEDGTIDVDGDVDLYECKLTIIPIKFRNVSGNFYCSKNRLKSLKNAPIKVSGQFRCSNNQLTSLKYAPEYVGTFFNCSYNPLISLEGGPKHVGNDYDFTDSKSIISLENDYNGLTSLKGSPDYVGGDFNVYLNNLTSLDYAPNTIYGTFRIDNNKIKNLISLPKSYNKIALWGNPIFDILKLFITMDWYNFNENTKENKDLLYEFKDREIIENDILILDRLVEFLEDIGKPRIKEYLQNLLQNEYTIR